MRDSLLGAASLYIRYEIMPPIHTAYFRKLPSVDEVLRSPEAQLWMVQSSRAVVTDAVRDPGDARQAILQATDEAALETLPLLLPAVLQQVQARLQAQQTYHLRRLINATGVIVHTNLGRSCWPRLRWRICKKWRNRIAIWNTISSAASAARAIPMSNSVKNAHGCGSGAGSEQQRGGGVPGVAGPGNWQRGGLARAAHRDWRGVSYPRYHAQQWRDPARGGRDE